MPLWKALPPLNGSERYPNPDVISFEGVGHSQRPLSGPAEMPSESAPEVVAMAEMPSVDPESTRGPPMPALLSERSSRAVCVCRGAIATNETS